MAIADVTTRQLDVSAIHELQNGRQLGSADAALLDAASTASLLARLERLNQGIDME